MKVTIDIPDETMCMFLSVIVNGEDSYLAKTEAYNDQTLRDGAEIKVNMERTDVTQQS